MTKLFSRKGLAALAVLALITVLGAGCWVYQQLNGLGVTGMSNANSWGAYIIMFMFFVGLSAGGLIVASSAHVFNIEAFKKVALPAVITSTVCICCAGLFVLLDLGGIARLWRMVTGPNPLSPLFWDMCVITCYLIINVLDMVWLVRGDHRKVEVLSRVALPVAILVHSVTAWIFGLQIAKSWYTALMAPIFVASACDSGLALLILGLMALERAGLFTTGGKLLKSLSGLLAVFIAVDAYFIGCELLTMAYPGGSEAVALGHMLTGATAPFFWFEMVFGLLVPFLVLVFSKNREKPLLIAVASCLVVAGVFCKRCWLLLTAFITPNVEGAAGITLGTTAAQAGGTGMWTLAGSYMPTGIELCVVAGVIALGVIGYALLSKLLLGRGAGERKEQPADSAVQAAE